MFRNTVGLPLTVVVSVAFSTTLWSADTIAQCTPTFSDCAMSHEVAEWLNDPFVGALAVGSLNIIPPAILPGQGGACIINCEVGDPLEALPTGPAEFTQVTNGTTYHLQDEVFLPWYLHTTPSFSVNGSYTFRNTMPAFSSLCGQDRPSVKMQRPKGRAERSRLVGWIERPAGLLRASDKTGGHNETIVSITSMQQSTAACRRCR